MKKAIVVLTSLLFVCGCGPSINDIQVGMSLYEISQKAYLCKLAQTQDCAVYRGEFRLTPYLLKFDSNNTLVAVVQDVEELQRRAIVAQQQREAQQQQRQTYEEQRQILQNSQPLIIGGQHDNYWQEERARQEYFQNLGK